MDVCANPTAPSLGYGALAPVSAALRCVARLRTGDGRTLRFIDDGEPGWRTLVFCGGLATSVGAFSLLEFARGTREALGLRVISVERNGLGETPLQETRGVEAAVDDILAVLEARDVGRYAIAGISGGGIYAAALAARAPERVLSLHLAGAAAGALTAVAGRARALFTDTVALAAAPATMWSFPPRSPVHRIPGFVAAARAEGARALPDPARGARALGHEWRLLTGTPLPKLRALPAPSHLYWGGADEVIPPVHIRAWRSALGPAVATRCYPGEGHDMHYRHWDQILCDVAGHSPRVLVSRDGAGALLEPDEARRALHTGAVLGLPGWRR